jgi:hypothetical protein
MSEQYHITMTVTGAVIVDVLNGQDNSCGRIIPRLATALGGPVHEDHKPEYYSHANDTQQIIEN